MLQLDDDMIQVDQRVTGWQLAVQLLVSNGSAVAITDALRYSKV
jgi:hypothetical protein